MSVIAQTPGWSDSEGDDCVQYGQSQWCTTDGKAGVGWDPRWGSFETFQHQGTNAARACCVCGGSSDVLKSCVDTIGWIDTDGDACSEYQSGIGAQERASSVRGGIRNGALSPAEAAAVAGVAIPPRSSRVIQAAQQDSVESMVMINGFFKQCVQGSCRPL